MKKWITTLVIMLMLMQANAQFGVMGGVSMLKAFGVPKPYIGMHIGGELPRDDNMTFYGRLSLYAKQNEPTQGTTVVTAYDYTTVPYSKTVNYTASFNYTIIEGGTRYYLGNGYDSGFGAYGGTTLIAAFNTVKRKYSDYDQTLYQLSPNELPKGSIFNFGFGLGGGVKNTFAGIGTIYLDLGISYFIISQGSNNTANMTNMYSQLLFSFGLGFRKEFY